MHRWQGEADRREKRDQNQHHQDRIGRQELASEDCADQLSPADQQQEHGDEPEGGCKHGSAQHQFPRFLAREVHPHDFGIIGLGEQIGGPLGGIGKARRDAVDRRAGRAEEAADDQPPDRSPRGAEAGCEVGENGEPPRAGKRSRAQRGPDPGEEIAPPHFTPRQEPEVKIAAEIGHVPDQQEHLEPRVHRPGDPGKDRSDDRVGRALPADEVEAVERAQHPAGRRRPHGRKQGAVEHRRNQILVGDPDLVGEERQQQDRQRHSAKPADHVERKGEAGRRLEFLAVAPGQDPAAVADDQLPRLELAEPAGGLGVADDEDQHPEGHEAERPAGKGQGREPRNRRNSFGRNKIAAVLQQRLEMMIFEPMLHRDARTPAGCARLGERQARVAAKQARPVRASFAGPPCRRASR